MEMPRPVGLWGAYVMGLAFAFGWTPCIGPILATILAVAASEATVAKGAGLLAVYSLGLGVPFIIAAFAVEPFAAFLARFRSKLGYVEKAMGGFAGADGLSVPVRLLHTAEYLADRGVPGPADDRISERRRAGRGRSGAIRFKGSMSVPLRNSSMRPSGPLRQV